MDKPKDLTGEVEKLESVGFSYYIRDEDPVYSIDECVYNLYSQPFAPELIEKYFEGWEKVSIPLYGDRLGNSIKIDIGGIELFSNKISSSYPIGNRYMKTLSDFISACINSDIKLRWKQ